MKTRKTILGIIIAFLLMSPLAKSSTQPDTLQAGVYLLGVSEFNGVVCSLMVNNMTLSATYLPRVYGEGCLITANYTDGETAVLYGLVDDISPGETILDVRIADLDGDGVKEAVLLWQDYLDCWADVIRFHRTADYYFDIQHLFIPTHAIDTTNISLCDDVASASGLTWNYPDSVYHVWYDYGNDKIVLDRKANTGEGK